MTLAVAKNCKMTKNSDTDDVINTSKISDIPQNFLNNLNVSRWSYISSFKSYKVFNLLAVANMSEKNTSRFTGGGVYTESTYHSYKKWKMLTIDAWDNFVNTGKNFFVYWRTKSEIRKVRKGGMYTPINPSPINGRITYLLTRGYEFMGGVPTPFCQAKNLYFLLHEVETVQVVRLAFLV